jgi:hypothetical protein
VNLFRRKKRDEVDPEAHSSETGLKYKDLALLGQMLQQGADLTKARHVLYYLYFESEGVASAAAEQGRGGGFACEVREPLPGYPGQWSVVCERPDAVLDIETVRGADDLFQGIADRHGGLFDGWEAAV